MVPQRLRAPGRARYGDDAAAQIEQRHRSAIDGIPATLAAIKMAAERD